jgi:signal transduction histidine kinase
MEPRSLNILTRIKRSPFVFPLAALAAAALMFISETAYRESTQSMAELSAMGQARISLQNVLGRVTDAETGQRGYLLTGRKEYLEPYREAFADIAEALGHLRGYYQNNPGRAQAEQLEVMVHRKLSELDAGIRLYDEGRHDNWRDLLLTDIGKETMDGIRGISATLIADETRRVAEVRQDIHDTLLLNRIGVAAMSVISLLALALYLRQTAALDAQQHAQQDAIEAERDRLERAVERRTAQLREPAQHLQTAREDERSLLARELHDELGALLTAAKLDAARIKSRIGSASPEAIERLVHLNETLNEGIALKRRIIEDLRPSSLSNLGLMAALEIQAREFRERSGLEVVCTLEPLRLEPAVELTVYRLVQEAFTNIAKYARATQVTVSLARRGAMAEIAVSDNGVGFDTSSHPTTAHGLLGMRYRVEAGGGKLRLDSAPGRGTRVSAMLPARPASAPAPHGPAVAV